MQPVLRILAIGGLALLALMVALILFLFRPWADHAPGYWFLNAIPSTRTWIFTHYEKIWPVDQLHPSASPRTYLRTLRPLETVRYGYADETRTVGDYLKRANVDGLLVLHGGRVVFEVYRNGLTPDTRHSLWSASKSFTVTVLGAALRDGVVANLDDPVQKYAPQFRGTAYGGVPIRHVAMMSSGVEFFHDSGRPNRNDMYVRLAFQGENLDDFAAGLGARVASGTDFNYLATDTHVLSAVLRGAYGQRYSDIVQQKLWSPGGFAGAATWSKHADGEAGVQFGHCCLQATLQDFAHLGQLYLDDLQVAGDRLAPAGWADLVMRPQADFQEPGERPRGYAMQWWVPKDYDGEAMALGAFGQILWVDRKRGVVVAQVAAYPNNPPTEAEENAVFRAIAAAAVGMAPAAT